VSKNLAVAKERASKAAASRVSVVARPGAALIGELGASVALWCAASPESLPWMTPALSLSTAGLAAMVWHIGRDHSPVGRILGIGSTVLTGAHLIAASIVGPFSSPLIGMWGWLGGTAVAAWVVRLWVARDDATVQGAKARASGWDSIAGKVGGALTGSSFQPKEVTADSMKGPLALEPGETIKDAQTSAQTLASVLGIPPASVTITPDPADASKGELSLVRVDVLRDVVPYGGPSALGGTAVQPYRIGRYRNAKPALLPLHIPGFGEVHLLIMGMTGAGKTMGAWQLIGEEFTRTETYTIYVDTVKGAQSLGPIAGGIRWAIRTEAEALALMKALKDRVIPGRAQYLGKRRNGKRGLKAWEPGCGLVRLRIHVEEGAGLFLGDKAFTRVLERARSVGVQITLSGQRFSYTSIDVSARSQFGAVWCFGVSDSEDAGFAMPDEVLAAGADPSVWKNKRPGCSYVVAPGIDDDDHVVPLRAELPLEEELEQLAEYSRLKGSELDQFTADLFGELYTSRIPVAEMLADDNPPDAVEDDDEDEDWTDGEDEDVQEPPWQPSESDPEPDVQPDIDDPITAVPEMSLGERPVKLPPAEARERFETRLRSLQEQGATSVTVKDLTPVALEAGMTASWLYKQLGQRVDSGHLERTDSGWRFVRALTPA
jgi:hypothetical protein